MVAVDCERAFEVFTAEVDAWWRRGPRFRWCPERDGVMQFEPFVGGRFYERTPSGEEFDLGAVQENERLMFAGVPWLVERLDLYTHLVNPALDGGTFTVPVTGLPSNTIVVFPVISGA